MLRKSKPDKPAKPYPDFPLTAHPNGQWAKKIKGKLKYFGAWDDHVAALNKYVDQRDELQAGREPMPAGLTVNALVGMFRDKQNKRLARGEISPRTFKDYEKIGKLIETLAGSRPLDYLTVQDFEKLADGLSKCGPTRQKNNLTYARMFFHYANENGLTEKPIRYKEPLKSPSAKTLRIMKAKRGSRMFTPEQVRKLIAAAPTPMRAFILLGLNAAFANTDCAMLTFDALDLPGGFHNFPRPKTANPRRAALWPETVKAIEDAIAKRPDDARPEVADYVFLTRFGGCWATRETGDNAISSEFRKLLIEVGCYTKFNTFQSLRRTAATWGGTTGETFAVSFLLGHVPPTEDMVGTHYRQKIYDAQVKRVTDRIRDIILGRFKLD